MVKVISVIDDGKHVQEIAQYWKNGKLAMVTDSWSKGTATQKMLQMCANLGYDPGEVINEEREPTEIFSK